MLIEIPTDPIFVLDRMATIVKNDMLVRRAYVSDTVNLKMAEAGAICGGRRACAIGSLAIAGGIGLIAKTRWEEAYGETPDFKSTRWFAVVDFARHGQASMFGFGLSDDEEQNSPADPATAELPGAAVALDVLNETTKDYLARGIAEDELRMYVYGHATVLESFFENVQFLSTPGDPMPVVDGELDRNEYDKAVKRLDEWRRRKLREAMLEIVSEARGRLMARVVA